MNMKSKYCKTCGKLMTKKTWICDEKKRDVVIYKLYCKECYIHKQQKEQKAYRNAYEQCTMEFGSKER